MTSNLVGMKGVFISGLRAQRREAQLQIQAGLRHRNWLFPTPRYVLIHSCNITSSAYRLAPAPKGGRSFVALKNDIVQDVCSMQQPSEIFMHMAYCLSLHAAIAIAIEAGLLQRLVATGSPQTAEELARELVSSPSVSKDALDREEFVTRLMRGLCGLKLVDETGPSEYLANALTEVFADPGFSQGWLFMHENLLGPQSTMSEAVSWAKESRYRAPTTAVDGPFQRARSAVGISSFAYYNQEDPASMSQLSAWMQRIQQDRLNWSAWLPADTIFGACSTAEEGIFMVDVGGGLGHDLNAFASRYPDREMQLVLQDQPSVIAEAKMRELDSRIALAAHNFFEPQPIKGAKIYFLHKIIHDWPDAECVKILTHLRNAMAPNSRIFLNDAIIPDAGSPLLYSAFDFSMFALLGAKERSKAMWKRLIDMVGGLQIRNFWQAPNMKGEGIVEVVKA